MRRVARLREEWSQGLIMLPPRPLALRIRETELSAEGLAHSRDGTIQLQEQQLRSLHEKLRRTGESHGSASRALEVSCVPALTNSDPNPKPKPNYLILTLTRMLRTPE